MTEKPEGGNEEYEKRVFEDLGKDVASYYLKAFIETTSFHSVPELVRDWAKESGYFEKEKNDATRNVFLAKVFARTSAIVSYVNHLVGEDTGNYKDPRDLRLHKDIIGISADVESNWDKRDDEGWKNKVMDDIKHRVFEYTKSKGSSTS